MENRDRVVTGWLARTVDKYKGWGMTRFCPNCGTPRIGSFRYCRSCQFDFDSGETAPVPAAQASRGPEVAEPSRSPTWSSAPTSATQPAPPVPQQPAAPAAPRSSGPASRIGALVLVVLAAVAIAGVFKAFVLDPGLQAQTRDIASAVASQIAPASPTADAQLAVACEALADFRAFGDHVSKASAALTEDYETWQPLASGLLSQLNRFLDASKALSADGRYAAWYVSSLTIAQSISEAVAEWDDGMSNDDAAAILRGNDAMSSAAAEVATMNAAAAEWEAECP